LRKDVSVAEYEQITRVGESIRVLAPGKINLSLLVAGKRPDGFHEIDTIMAKINLFDELLIEGGEKAGIELVCKGPQWAPEGQDNLVCKAAKLFLETCGRSNDIRITLTKNLPAGAGLGGASSDAAATLIGLNEYLGLGLQKNDLSKLAANLGSDVAFFLDGPLAFCTGRGEKIREIREKFDFKAILLLPKISCSTTRVYTNYHHDELRFHTFKREIGGVIAKNRIDLVTKMCANMLESACFGLYRELAELKAQVETLGIKPWCLSGSGSAMYHIVETSDAGRVDEYIHRIKRQTPCDVIIVTNNRW
jgi:4-diphosphocytidyl-2-C-methyl-D-erythritol kinase